MKRLVCGVHFLVVSSGTARSANASGHARNNGERRRRRHVRAAEEMTGDRGTPTSVSTNMPESLRNGRVASSNRRAGRRIQERHLCSERVQTERSSTLATLHDASDATDIPATVCALPTSSPLPDIPLHNTPRLNIPPHNTPRLSIPPHNICRRELICNALQSAATSPIGEVLVVSDTFQIPQESVTSASQTLIKQATNGYTPGEFFRYPNGDPAARRLAIELRRVGADTNRDVNGDDDGDDDDDGDCSYFSLVMNESVFDDVMSQLRALSRTFELEVSGVEPHPLVVVRSQQSSLRSSTSISSKESDSTLPGSCHSNHLPDADPMRDFPFHSITSLTEFVYV